MHHITAGWANKCGKQLFTIGWVPCVVLVAETEFGGNQFLIFKPILDEVAAQMFVGDKVLPYLQISDTEVIVDGKKYTMVAQRSPSEIIRGTPGIDGILAEAVDKLGVSKRNARSMLFDEIIKELKKVEKVKESVFNDDDQIIMILVATDDL
jgi:hypothetical protein